MIEISIDATALNVETARLANLITDTTPLMQNIGTALESIAQQAFQDETSPDGEPWARRSATTLLLLGNKTAGKRQKFGAKGQVLASWQKAYDRGAKDGAILQDTGKLLGSLFTDASRDSVEIGAGSGVSAAYALIHQKGGQAGRNQKVTIPARPYMPITADDELMPAAQESCLATLMEYLKA